MEENEKEMEEYYWEVIEALATALRQQKVEGKYDVAALQTLVDELDLECDRRVVFSEPADEVNELKEVLEEFVEVEE